MSNKVMPILVLLSVLIFMSCRDKGVEPQSNDNLRGSIFIQSDPEGARIYVNGLFRNIYTPDTLSRLFPGIYEIELRRGAPFLDTNFVVYLQEGKQLTYYISLRNNNH